MSGIHHHFSLDGREVFSHQQEFNFPPRPPCSPHGQVFLSCPLFHPPLQRLIEIHRHGIGDFSDSNKTQHMDRSRGGRAYSEMDCLPLTGMGGVKCATIRFTHGIRRPLRSCQPPKSAAKKPKGGKIVALWDLKIGVNRAKET